MSDLDHLTEEERRILAMDDEIGEETEADEANPTDESPPADAAPESEDDASSGEADKDDAGDAAASAEGPQSFNVPTGDLGEIETAINQLQTAREELEAAYEAGDSELTYAEHRAKLREIEGALLDLNAERAEVKAIQKVNAAYQQEWWNREIKSFKREALKTDGVNYDQDKKLEAEWDKAVRYLGSDPDNADKDAAWFLKEAHEIVKARFRLGRHESAVPPAQKRLSKVDEALAVRRAQASPAPKTLSGLPEAGQEAVGQGEFSYLERLSGIALEQAVAKLTKEQEARWAMEQ